MKAYFLSLLLRPKHATLSLALRLDLINFINSCGDEGLKQGEVSEVRGPCEGHLSTSPVVVLRPPPRTKPVLTLLAATTLETHLCCNYVVTSFYQSLKQNNLPSYYALLCHKLGN